MATKFTSEFYNIASSFNVEDYQMYLYVSDNRDITSQVYSNSYQNAVISNIVWGKKIELANTFSMIRLVEWQANKLFAMYDDNDPDLIEKDFYCLNTNRAVYKCLNNNGGKPSTQEPQSFSLLPFSTSDGYTWKFMYRLSIEELNERSFNNYIPVIEDEEVINNSVSGTIDSIVISNPGLYPAINSGFIISKVSNFVFRIQDTAYGLDGYYDDSAFYIEAGPATGSLSKINRYYSNTSGRYVELTDPISTATNVSSYSIAPYVNIVGDGENSKARAIMNNDGSIKNIEILASGFDYSYSFIEIQTSSLSSFTPAITRPIISPLKGHGGNPKEELFTSDLLISIDINGSELNTITVPVDLNNFGLVKNIKLSSNTSLNYSNTTFNNLVEIETLALNGEFNVGEIVYLDTNENIRAKILNKTTGPNYRILYEGNRKFTTSSTIQNALGTTAFVRVIYDNAVSLSMADILTYDNIDLVTHGSDDKTTFNIMIGTKPQ